jgi:DNA polymerase III delta prime subunit
MQNVSWCKKYEPKNLDKMVLNPDIYNVLENLIKNPQSVILYGQSGVGKGTFTNIFLEKTGCIDLWKNASNETSIDMVRKDIIPFADSASHRLFFPPIDTNKIKGTHMNLKCVVLNEAENLSKEAQASLREVMERSDKRCKFIFMTNNIDKIDSAIQSRCLLVAIKNPPIPDMLNLLERIIESEKIRYDNEKLIGFVHKHYPDIRKTINDIQGHCGQGVLETDESNQLNNNLDKVLLDLKLYMTFYNREKRDIYNSLKDYFEFSVSERQFYYLLSGNGAKKVSDKKKASVINCILEKIPVKDWIDDYMRMNA